MNQPAETRPWRAIKTLALLVVCLLLSTPVFAQNAVNWAHQWTVAVVNPGATLTDYQVKVVLNTANFDFSLTEPDGSDLRFSDVDGVMYPYWIETWDPVGEQAVAWVRIPELPAGDTITIVLLSGNPGVADASDGAATFLFYSGFEESVAAANMNAPDPLVTPTYDGSGQVVHPDVVHVPGGWNGYEYWMGMTPYPYTNSDYENPSVLVSNDNVTWIVPPGVVNPLVPEPLGHNDDVDMLLVDGEMVMYYNETNDDGNTYLMRLASTDGVDWGVPQTVITLPNYVMSPTVIHDGSVYTMWYVRSAGGCSAPSQDFYRRTSGDGITWGPEEAAVMVHPDRVLWHLDVQLVDGVYTMLFVSYPDGSTCGNTQLYYAESVDGLNWTANLEPLLVPSASGWDNASIYRASYTLAGTWLRVWYSARSSDGQWYVGFTEGEKNDFVTTLADIWFEINGSVAATVDHPRTGTYGLREIGGTTSPQVFGALTGGSVCVNVWYWEEMSTAADFMALLRLWDSDASASPRHCIGTGIWTGTSLVNYNWHDEGFIYTDTIVPRTSGWRHLSIALGTAVAELRIDGTTVATTDALDPALVNRFSVEGYSGGTGYFDDAYVCRYADIEPVVLVGEPGVVGIDGWPDDEPGYRPPSPMVILEQNVPNPLNPDTRITFSLPRAGFVTLQIIDLRGRVVRTLLAETRREGRNTVTWNGRDERGNLAASGTYLYRLITPERVISRKLMLVK